ncbi:MAG: sulfite oxidase, partial [Pararhizobium sp.]
ARAPHRLGIPGPGARPLTLDLPTRPPRFTRRQVEATLHCAGTRRSDMRQVRPVKGDPWGPGAIGNAVWTGIRLADVLEAAGAADDAGLHVAFAGLDACDLHGKRFRYGVSIPIEKAIGKEVLLAWEMNGAPLAPEHGAPLRMIVPGYAGVRSAKWLASITVQAQPADTPVQAIDYHLYPAEVTEEPSSPGRGLVINGMPLNSAICEPADGAVLSAGRTAVRGWAFGGDRAIARVDVSANGGRTWVQARLEPAGGRWSWTFWIAEFPIAPGSHDLVVRAWDSAGQTQPDKPDDTWNAKGYLAAFRHRIRIEAL